MQSPWGEEKILTYGAGVVFRITDAMLCTKLIRR